MCRSLHDKVFSKLDVQAWQFLPPNHWKCRSDAEDVLGSYSGEITSFDDAVAKDPEGYERMVKSGFAVNWGDAKQVFSATQSYLKNADVEPLDVQTLTFKDYDLDEHSKINDLENLSTVKLLFETFVDRSGLGKIIDVFEFPVWIEKQVFDTAEVKLRNNLLDVLKNPSEVFWHTEGDINYKTFLKFYKDETIEVLTSFQDKELAKVLSIKSIEQVDEVRKGLLLYTPKEHIAKRLAQYEGFDKAYKKMSFNEDNGGFIVLHNLHGANEINGNLITSKVLQGLGKGVELLPIGEGKSADALVNNVEWEFKLLKEYTNLFNTVKREVKRASKQAPNVLLHIVGKYDKDEVIRGLIAAINNDTERAVKFVTILTPDEKLFTLSRKQIETKEFIKILNQ
jgi:hypothetical protein